MSHDSDNNFEFRAVRDIKVGEELCVSYTHPFLAKAERMDMFEKGWGFCCQCPACEDTDEGHAIKEIVGKMIGLSRELGDELVVKRGLVLSEVMHKRRLPKIQKLTALMKVVGFVGLDMLR